MFSILLQSLRTVDLCSQCRSLTTKINLIPENLNLNLRCIDIIDFYSLDFDARALLYGFGLDFFYIIGTAIDLTYASMKRQRNHKGRPDFT